MLNFWYNLANGDENKISPVLYKWVKLLYDQNLFKSLWLDKIKTILDHISMSYLFNNIANTNTNWFKNTVKLKLKDIYEQKWKETVFSNTICLNYRAMTKYRKLQNYFLNLPSQYMYAFCKFKCANHKMPIVTGRYSGIPLDDRICTLCNLNEIGDEFHYLFKCIHFNDQRIKCISSYYYTNPNMYKFEKLFNEISGRNLLNLSKFTYYIVSYFRNL